MPRLFLPTLLALLSGVLPAAAQEDDDPIPLPWPPASACLNTHTTPLLSGVANYIPVTSNKGFYVVYSGRWDALPPANTEVSNTVGIFVLPLKKLDPQSPRRALIYGAGYGGGPINAKSAAYDANLVAKVLEDGLARLPGQTTLLFVTPHGHFDHVNSDFVAQLESRGYAFEQILYHPKDWELDEDCQGGSGCSFASEYEFTLMSQMNFGDITLTPLTNFPLTGSLLDSNLGTITLEHAPGHTCGTLDVRVDWTDTVGGQPQARRAWLRGAGCNVSYTPGQVVGGVAITCDIDPHGNVVLTGSPVCP